MLFVGFTTMIQKEKQQAIDILRRRIPGQLEMLADIDMRLAEYFAGLVEEPTMHNGYELLGAVKFLRLLRTYEFNTQRVKKIVRLREGEWRQDTQGRWRHVEGGIAQPGTGGPKVYRWEPFQVFVLASVFGFRAWIDTQLTTADRSDLLATERVENGKIYDLRRLCTDFTFYGPRKTDKTGLSAFLQVVFFLMEDQNAECYCCSNSADQSKLLFSRTVQMLRQLDDGHRFRITQTVCEWRQAFQQVRNSSIRPLSAGGKTKDGMFAQLCCADEFGSAPYINGRSDMKLLVDVIASSMGPRREPLVFTTTTAGRINVGPFIEKLESLHNILMKELEWDTNPTGCGLSYDRTLCICYEPDDWEKQDEEYLLTSRDVRRKVNPMLGRIVQHQFYSDGAAKARMEGDTGEYISKFINVYQSATVEEWVSPEKIRTLQLERRIEDCTAGNGWVVFCGLDFSQGDDLHTAGYLAVRRGQYGGYEYFGDFDAWVKQDVMEHSSIRPLYEEWVRKGWLHISPGEVFQPALFIQRLDSLLRAGVQFQYFGYDAYQSADPINSLKAYLVEKMGVAEPEHYVVPVSQTNASFNPAVDQMTYCIKAEDPMLHLCNNPMWPWLFGNTVIESDRMENKKPRKRNSGSDSCKVDPVQCLAMGYLLASRFEGTGQRI